MNNLHPIFQRALAPFAPPPITKGQTEKTAQQMPPRNDGPASVNKQTGE